MNCDDCRFYRTDLTTNDPEMGTCHKRPPRVFVYPGRNENGDDVMLTFTAWARPPEPRWCGEFEPDEMRIAARLQA